MLMWGPGGVLSRELAPQLVAPCLCLWRQWQPLLAFVAPRPWWGHLSSTVRSQPGALGPSNWHFVHSVRSSLPSQGLKSIVLHSTHTWATSLWFSPPGSLALWSGAPGLAFVWPQGNPDSRETLGNPDSRETRRSKTPRRPTSYVAECYSKITKEGLCVHLLFNVCFIVLWVRDAILEKLASKLQS